MRSILNVSLCVAAAALFCVACDNDDSDAGSGVAESAVLIVAVDEGDALRDRLIEITSSYLERVTGEVPGVVRLSDSASSREIVAAAEEARAGLVLVLDAQRLAPDAAPFSGVLTLQ